MTRTEAETAARIAARLFCLDHVRPSGVELATVELTALILARETATRAAALEEAKKDRITVSEEVAQRFIDSGRRMGFDEAGILVCDALQKAMTERRALAATTKGKGT